MTEQPPSAIGTVAQEAARLIEEVATMARSSIRGSDGPQRYSGGPAQEPGSPDAPPAARPVQDPDGPGEPFAGPCSLCGHEPGGAAKVAGTQVAATCRICPVCRGLALLRAVRPETVDLLADLAVALATSLRDVATRSRASDPASSARADSGHPPDGERATVHDIPVDDETEG